MDQFARKQVHRQVRNNRRVLVTGGLGFIGYHLSEALLRSDPGCDLTIVDNLSSTRLDYSSLVNRADIQVEDLRTYQPENSSFDDIYHLASPVGSLGILERHGFIANDILELAQAANRIASNSGANLLYLSSSEVYGHDGAHAESIDLVVPDRHGTRMEYALGKLTAEHVLMNLADGSKHSVRIVRPFNVVGRWQSKALGFVIPAFFEAALADEPLLVHGNGEQTRSFCDVDDLVNGLIAVQTLGHSRKIYNVGNPANRTTILQLAKNIKTLCRSNSPVQLIDPNQRYGAKYLEAYNKMPVIDRVTEDTGWLPKADLTTILEKILTSHRLGTPDIRGRPDSRPNSHPGNQPANQPSNHSRTRSFESAPAPENSAV